MGYKADKAVEESSGSEALHRAERADGEVIEVRKDREKRGAKERKGKGKRGRAPPVTIIKILRSF